MEKLIEFIFNIRPSSWVRGGQWKLEWLSMPKHDAALLLAGAMLGAIWVVSLLYRREGKAIRPLGLWFMVVLRLVVLATVLIMLLEPVLIFDKTEYAQSNLIVLSDSSESMDLRDAYVDDHLAQQTARALKLNGVEELRKSSRRALGERALGNGLLAALEAGGDRLVRRHDFAGKLSGALTTQPTAQGTTQPTSRPGEAGVVEDRSATAVGAAIRQAIAAYQGQPVAGILLLTDGPVQRRRKRREGPRNLRRPRVCRWFRWRWEPLRGRAP